MKKFVYEINALYYCYYLKVEWFTDMFDESRVIHFVEFVFK